MISNRYKEAVAAQFPVDFEPNRLDDIVLTRDYLEQGAPCGQPILLSMGENWEGPSPVLRGYLSQAPAHLAGYQFSMWGEPNLVQALTSWARGDYAVAPGTDFCVAACWSGTRGVLADIGLIIGRTRPRSTLVCVTPGYDYANVMNQSDFVIRQIPVLDEESTEVCYDAILEALNEQVGAIVINAQHNPIAHQWPSEILREVLSKCLRYGIIPIFDDAHKAIHGAGVTAVDAVSIWLRMIEKAAVTPEWYLLRSLGKQLNTNGWGIGMVAGPNNVMENLVLQVRPRREYAIQGAQQWAIAQYLDSDDMASDTRAFIHRVDENRDALSTKISNFDGIASQVCTPFSWFPLPPSVSRAEIMKKTGVLLGDLHPTPLLSNSSSSAYARIYLGIQPSDFEESLSRLGSMIGNG